MNLDWQKHFLTLPLLGTLPISGKLLDQNYLSMKVGFMLIPKYRQGVLQIYFMFNIGARVVPINK